jgi:hypothetical protein
MSFKYDFVLKTHQKNSKDTYNVWILFNGENVSLANVLSWLSYNDNKLNFSNPRNVSPRTHTILFALSNLYVEKQSYKIKFFCGIF